MVNVEEIQKLDDDSLLELYRLVREHIQFLEGSIIDTSIDEEAENE